MSYCLNPDCPKPESSQITNKFCSLCGALLLLKERYRCLKKIGQGGFGKTLLAWDESKPTKPYCLIKQFLPSAKGTKRVEKAAKLFKAEAMCLDQLGQHEQIPELLAHFESDGELYLVQEFIQGHNLAQELKEKGAFNEIKVRQFLENILPVLQFIHQHRVIHRDIKPENIIRQQGSEQLVLVDFGAAKFVRGTEDRTSGTEIGTPGYAAPEQLLGKIDFRSDIYSLGVTSIHLLTGVEPYDLFDNGDDRWRWWDYLRTSITESLGEILDKMIQKGTNHRYHSVGTISEDLKTLPPPNPSVSIGCSPEPVGDSVSLPRGLNSSQQANTLIEISSEQDNSFWSSQEDLFVREQRSTSSIPISQTLPPSDLPPPEPVAIGTKWGYADKEGKVVTRLIFDAADKFSEGLGKVKIDNQWGYIQVNGKLFIQPQFDDAERFCQGLAKVGKWGYIDRMGRIVIAPQFDYAGHFAQGLAAVVISQEWGYINTQGHMVIKPQFRHGSRFHNGRTEVMLKSKSNEGLNIDKIHYIDKHGNFLTK